MIKNICISISVAILLLTGCVKEDIKVCGLHLIVKYDHNTTGTGDFLTDIDKINLFVFDENGIFVGEYSDEGEYVDGTYRIRLYLTPGIYDFVAWGNLSDDYEITQFVPGVTTIGQARLSLKTNGSGEVATHPGKLFYGSATRIYVNADQKQVQVIDMIKDTNLIRVIARGLPYDFPGGRSAPGTPFSCRISDNNGNYDFYNSLAGSTQLTYIPQYGVQAHELISEFVVMRLFSDGESRIIVTYNPESPMQPVELFNERLSLFVPPGTDFDRQDEYQVTLDFDETFACFSITVNGWETVLGSVIIG